MNIKWTLVRPTPYPIFSGVPPMRSHLWPKITSSHSNFGRKPPQIAVFISKIDDPLMVIDVLGAPHPDSGVRIWISLKVFSLHQRICHFREKSCTLSMTAHTIIYWPNCEFWWLNCKPWRRYNWYRTHESFHLAIDQKIVTWNCRIKEISLNSSPNSDVITIWRHWPSQTS